MSNIRLDINDGIPAPGWHGTLTIFFKLPKKRQKLRIFLRLSKLLSISNVKSYAGADTAVSLMPPGYEEGKFNGHPETNIPEWDWGDAALLSEIPATGVFDDDVGEREIPLSWSMTIMDCGSSPGAHQSIEMYVLSEQDDAQIAHQIYKVHITDPSLGVLPEILPPGATFGGNYEVDFSLKSSPKNAAISFALAEAGRLPKGLNLSGNGELRGTPLEGGEFPFELLVRGDGDLHRRKYMLSVARKPVAYRPDRIALMSDLVLHDTSIGERSVGGPFYEGMVTHVTNRDRYCERADFLLRNGKLIFSFLGKSHATGNCYVTYKIKNLCEWSDLVELLIVFE